MIGWLFLALSVACTVAAQLCFKQHHRARRRGYLILAVALFCSAVPCTLLATRQLGIGKVYVGGAAAYVLTPIAAARLFREQLRPAQWLALALIVAGIFLYGA